MPELMQLLMEHRSAGIAGNGNGGLGAHLVSGKGAFQTPPPE